MAVDHRTTFFNSYAATKLACGDIKSAGADAALRYLVLLSLRFLKSDCTKVVLTSKVAGKKYIAYALKTDPAKLCRPANDAFFVCDADYIDKHWDEWMSGKMSAADSQKIAYTVGLAPCLVMELYDRGNKKGPATYFECYIGHLFAKTLGVNPKKAVRLPVEGGSVRMTMDFLFDLDGVGLHLPVKMSTRERVVQAWAHQALLDRAYGDGSYKAIMVLFSETKLDSKKREVVEICVPDQWFAYQSLLAKMDRIYYFDMPDRYKALTVKHPNLLSIKPFGDFFNEHKTVLALKQKAVVTTKAASASRSTSIDTKSLFSD